MILCLCKVVTDRDLEAAVARGARNLEDVADLCGAGTDCGSCVQALARRLADRRRGRPEAVRDCSTGCPALASARS